MSSFVPEDSSCPEATQPLLPSCSTSTSVSSQPPTKRDKEVKKDPDGPKKEPQNELTEAEAEARNAAYVRDWLSGVAYKTYLLNHPSSSDGEYDYNDETPWSTQRCQQMMVNVASLTQQMRRIGAFQDEDASGPASSSEGEGQQQGATAKNNKKTHVLRKKAGKKKVGGAKAPPKDNLGESNPSTSTATPGGVAKLDLDDKNPPGTHKKGEARVEIRGILVPDGKKMKKTYRVTFTDGI